jgi:hypothetical protein
VTGTADQGPVPAERHQSRQMPPLAASNPHTPGSTVPGIANTSSGEGSADPHTPVLTEPWPGAISTGQGATVPLTQEGTATENADTSNVDSTAKNPPLAFRRPLRVRKGSSNWREFA